MLGMQFRKRILERTLAKRWCSIGRIFPKRTTHIYLCGWWKQADSLSSHTYARYEETRLAKIHVHMAIDLINQILNLLLHTPILCVLHRGWDSLRFLRQGIAAFLHSMNITYVKMSERLTVSPIRTSTQELKVKIGKESAASAYSPKLTQICPDIHSVPQAPQHISASRRPVCVLLQINIGGRILGGF